MSEQDWDDDREDEFVTDKIDEDDDWEDEIEAYLDDALQEGSFNNLPIKHWRMGQEVREWENMAIKLRLPSYDEVEEEGAEAVSWVEQFQALLDVPGSERLTTLVIGAWYDETKKSGEAFEALVAARDRLPNLQALYIGDMTFEESELSWIHPGDLSAVLEAFPKLRSLFIHGTNGLSLGAVNMPELQDLVLFSGGLSGRVVREVVQGHLPALERLELYLGTPRYGGDATPEDLAPLLRDEVFPSLKHLGLKNSERQDEFVQVIAEAPILKRLDSLDVSEGALGDEGVLALLASPHLQNLKVLDVSHNWCSQEVRDALRALPLEVTGYDYPMGQPEDGRFISFSE